MRFTQDGILVNSELVPLVVAFAVSDVIGLYTPPIKLFLHSTPPTVTPAEAVFSAIVSTFSVLETETPAEAVFSAIVSTLSVVPMDADVVTVSEDPAVKVVPDAIVVPDVIDVPPVITPEVLSAPVMSNSTVGLAFLMPT